MRRSSGLWRDEMRDSMNWSIGKRRFWLNSRIASFWLARSCERVLRTSGDSGSGGRRDGFQGGVQEKVLSASLSGAANGQPQYVELTYFGVLKTIVSGTLYSQLTSIKTDIIIDTWAMIFPSRSQVGKQADQRDGASGGCHQGRPGRNPATASPSWIGPELPGREPDQMGQRHSLRPVRPRSCRGALRNGSLCCISTRMWALPF